MIYNIEFSPNDEYVMIQNEFDINIYKIDNNKTQLEIIKKINCTSQDLRGDTKIFFSYDSKYIIILDNYYKKQKYIYKIYTIDDDSLFPNFEYCFDYVK